MVSNVQGANLYAFIQQNKDLGSQKLMRAKDDFYILSKKEWKDLLKNNDRDYIKSTYKQSLESLGESFNKYLDEQFGNNDGKLDFDEFKKANLFNTKKTNKFLQDAFHNLDIDKDECISNKEWAALFYLADKSVNDHRRPCPDARLDAFSLMAALKEMNRKDVGKTFAETFQRMFGNN